MESGVVESESPRFDLRSLVDAVPAMLAYWDTDLRCRFANRAYERWFGVAPETLPGMHVHELLGPLYELNLPHIEAALRGQVEQFEREIPDPAGGPPRFSFVTYIPDVRDGIVYGFFAIGTDITSAKRAEIALARANAQLRQSEERFRLMFEEAPIGMALVALTGRFVRVNRAMCEIVGYRADELLGRTFQSITHPEDLDIDVGLAGKLASGEITRYRFEKRYLRKDGMVVRAQLGVSVLRGEDGQPSHFISQIEDITERKRLDEEQRFLAEVGAMVASSLEYEETIDRVANLIVHELADFCVIDSAEEGGRRVKVVSRDPAHSEVSHAMMERGDEVGVLRAVLETRQPVLLHRPAPEIEELLPGLGARSVIAVPMIARDTLIGAIKLISTRRSYGPADMRLAQEVARRAALSIDNARLYQEARRATQARDDVLAVVAHDLRNPLYAVLLRAKTLERTGAAGAAAASAIEHSANRMNRMITDLLDLSLMEAGRLTVEPQTIDPAGILNDAVAAQRPLATDESIELVSELAPDLPPVRADPDRLLQVFENLIGNAIKFAPRARVTVGAAPGTGEVVFRVSDTGRGIAAEELPHVFDRFWQARRTDRRGAGLGLPIAKGIIEAHRGRMWVESRPGAGTTFYFTVPTC